MGSKRKVKSRGWKFGELWREIVYRSNLAEQKSTPWIRLAPRAGAHRRRCTCEWTAWTLILTPYRPRRRRIGRWPRSIGSPTARRQSALWLHVKTNSAPGPLTGSSSFPGAITAELAEELCAQSAHRARYAMSRHSPLQSSLPLSSMRLYSTEFLLFS